MIIDAIIEIGYNTNINYEFDEKEKRIRCDRVMNTSMVYPANYGYIPNTLGGDGDPLDILVVCDYSLYPGIIIEVKVIGVLVMEDEKGMDEKIIAVPSNSVDKNYINIHTLEDLRPNTLNKINHFFKHYKENDDNKWCLVHTYENMDFATELIKKCAV